MLKVALLNWLVINSVLSVDDKVPYVYRVLPTASIKQKRNKWLTDSLDNQEPEEIIEERMDICQIRLG